MGLNSYLCKKVNYKPNMPAEVGCGGSVFSTYVQELQNGFVWKDKYYKDLDALNKEFYQKFHIGKSSYGWYYSLAIYPEYGINNLEDWKKMFEDSSNFIIDEEDRVVSAVDMLDSIINRKHRGYEDFNSEQDFEQSLIEVNNNFIDKWEPNRRHYRSYDELLAANHAMRGKNGLWRRQADRYTISTDGTYDYIISGNDANDGVIFS